MIHRFESSFEMVCSYVLNKTVEEYINSRTKLYKPFPPLAPLPKKETTAREVPPVLCVRFFTGQKGLRKCVSLLHPSLAQDGPNEENWPVGVFGRAFWSKQVVYKFILLIPVLFREVGSQKGVILLWTTKLLPLMGSFNGGLFWAESRNNSYLWSEWVVWWIGKAHWMPAAMSWVASAHHYTLSSFCWIAVVT